VSSRTSFRSHQAGTYTHRHGQPGTRHRPRRRLPHVLKRLDRGPRSGAPSASSRHHGPRRFLQLHAEPDRSARRAVENSSLYYERASRTWWLFTKPRGAADGLEYKDAIWACWTTNLDRLDPAHKAVVLDLNTTANWSAAHHRTAVCRSGWPALAIFYIATTAEQMPSDGQVPHRTATWAALSLHGLELCPLVPRRSVIVLRARAGRTGSNRHARPFDTAIGY